MATRKPRFGTLPKGERWTVWGLDVWGNEEDGFEVNDRNRIGTILLRPEASDREIVNALKNEWLMNARVKLSDVNIDGDDMLVFIEDAKNGEPVLQLTRED